MPPCVRVILAFFPHGPLQNQLLLILQEAHWSEQALDLSPIEWLHLGKVGSSSYMTGGMAGWLGRGLKDIVWTYPPCSNSHHQDFCFPSSES